MATAVSASASQSPSIAFIPDPDRSTCQKIYQFIRPVLNLLAKVLTYPSGILTGLVFSTYYHLRIIPTYLRHCMTVRGHSLWNRIYGAVDALLRFPTIGAYNGIIEGARVGYNDMAEAPARLYAITQGTTLEKMRKKAQKAAKEQATKAESNASGLQENTPKAAANPNTPQPDSDSDSDSD